MEKYKNEDGDIAVLVSSGFGAGWSSWNDDKSFLTMDKTLVEMHLVGKDGDEVAEYIESTGREAPYTGGWYDLHVEYLTPGTAFTIDEYDGSESLTTLDSLTLVT